MLGDNLKKIRLANGYSQAYVASRLHVTRQTVSSWETNRTEPTMGNIEMLARIYGCYKSDLLGEGGKESKYVTDLMKESEPFAPKELGSLKNAKNVNVEWTIRRCNMKANELLLILDNMTPGRRLKMLDAIFTLLKFRYIDYKEDEDEEDLP